MISERTLKRWRKEALVYKAIPTDQTMIEATYSDNNELRQRILKLTQELLDQHLVRKG